MEPMDRSPIPCSTVSGTDRDRDELKTRAARGVFVSEHLGLRSKDYLEGLMKDRFENSMHLDLLGMLVAPRKARVLEIRPRTGMISEGLRRLFDAEVHALPIWESQRILLNEVYGIPSAGLVNYDEFNIPYPGQFDLIICNHMLTHAVRPQRFFEAIHRSLKPAGYIYFYNEPDDAEYLLVDAGDAESIAHAVLRHELFRAGPCGERAERGVPRSRNMDHMSLARLEPTSFVPITQRELTRRIRL